MIVPPSSIPCADIAAATAVLTPGSSAKLWIASAKRGAIAFDAAAGAWISFHLSGIQTAPALQSIPYVIYSMTNATLATGTVPAGPAGSIQIPPLSVAGTYLLVLSPSSSSSASVSVAMELDSTIVADGSILAVPATPNGQTRRVRFDGTSGQFLGLAATPVTGRAAVTYARPDNSYMLTSTWSTDASDDLPSLTQTGAHAILMNSNQGVGTSFSTSLTLSNDVVGALTLDGSSQTYAATRVGQNARYTFPLSAGASPTIWVANATAGKVFDISAFTPTGSSAGTTYLNGNLPLIRISAAPSAGTYSVRVGARGNQLGSIDVRVGYADLQVTSVQVKSVTPKAGGGYNIRVAHTVTNAGTVGAYYGWSDRVYLTAGGVDTEIGQYQLYWTTLVNPGGTYSADVTYATTASVQPGNYTLSVRADWLSNNANGQLAESNESNNIASVAVTLP